MASAANYRIYELTIGNQVAGSRTIACDSDQNAIEKAKKMLDERDLEALDVTGWLGGYNFQWAWSSGWCAGQAVS